MTFEEETAEAFRTLTERLRSHVDQEVQRRTAEIAAAAPPPVAPTPVEASPRPDTSSAARLTEAVRSIDAARSLTGILDALVTAARAEAASADVWLSRGGQLHPWRSAESDGAAPAMPTGSLVVPIALAGSDVAFLYADLGEDGTADVEQRTANLELLTRYAARSLEALTAFKTARALTQRTGTGTTAPEPSVADDASAEEDTSARRYARLLVSEIKLYHEPAVIEGRRDRDLAVRLGGEINRARAMYEQRVPPHVRERADYFYDELVRTLANGDGSLLEVRT